MIFYWHINGVLYEVARYMDTCPSCTKVGTLTALPAPLLAAQPDDTNIVCNPAFGGCNQGFVMEGK